MAIVDQFSEQELRQIVQESFSYKEVLQKLGYVTFGGNNNTTLKSRLEKYNIDVSHFTTKKGIVRNEDNIFCKNSTATQATLRRWFLKREDIPYKCSCCGISEWRGEKLSLQLDHINGDNHDNRIENLHWVCPNCHSQTDTFCGKKIKKNHITSNGIKNEAELKELHENRCIDCGKLITVNATRCPECAAKATRIVERPDANELLTILKKYNGNFTEVGRMFNVTDNAIRKWCKVYNLPYRTKDYRQNK